MPVFLIICLDLVYSVELLSMIKKFYLKFVDLILTKNIKNNTIDASRGIFG